MGLLTRDPVCHLPRHGTYPKGSSCPKCRAAARKYGTTPEPVKHAVAEAQLPTCSCGRKIRGGHCPNPGCP